MLNPNEARVLIPKALSNETWATTLYRTDLHFGWTNHRLRYGQGLPQGNRDVDGRSIQRKALCSPEGFAVDPSHLNRGIQPRLDSTNGAGSKYLVPPEDVKLPGG